MQTIKFIARPLREKPEWSGEDVNGYEVKYDFSSRGILGTSGSSFSNLLLEAICGLPEANPNKERVIVSLEGDFPEKYVDETKKVFDFYSRAENVEVDIMV